MPPATFEATTRDGLEPQALFFLWPTSCGFLPLEMPGPLSPQEPGGTLPKGGACCGEERGRGTWTELVQCKKWLSHHSSAGALAFSSFRFSPFPEGENIRSAITERELGKWKMFMTECLREMGSAGERNGVCSGGWLTRQQNGLLVLQYTWCLLQYCCKIIHVYVN